MRLSECTLATCDLEYAYVDYVPTLAGNAIYAALFAILFFVQLFLGVKFRTWSFSVGMVMGVLLEVVGYVGRIGLHGNPFIFNYFLIYLVCLTIAPAFLTSSIYFSLSRIITIAGPQYSLLPPRAYTIIFIICDLVALILQALGGALASTAKDHEASELGTHIMVAGLAWQVVSMGLFLGLWGNFAWRVRSGRKMEMGMGAGREGMRDGENGGMEDEGIFSAVRNSAKLRNFQLALATATLLIFLRCIYRVAELQGGFSGAIANNEPVFMVLEGPLIILAVTLLSIFHPGRVFGDLWARAGKHAKKGKAEGYLLTPVG